MAALSIKGKDILLFFGSTGAGKTTTIKGLLGYRMVVKKQKGLNCLAIDDGQKVDPIVDRMASNAGSKSVTRFITAVKPDANIASGDIYFVDSPGFGDTAGKEVEIANIVGVMTALKGCKSIIPVLVISKNSWGNRGTGIR